MDDKHTNDTLLIERYLQGKLSVEEAAEFEEQFLGSDHLLDELESAERLQQGLQDLTALDKANAPARGRRGGGVASNVVAIFQSPRYAMAASFLLLLSFGFSGFLYQQNARLSELGQSLAGPAEIVQMVTVRGVPGSEPVNVLNLEEVTGQFVMLLDSGYVEYSHFRATVYSLDPAAQPEQVWQVDDMKPSPYFEDTLVLVLPGDALQAGDFEVRIEGWRDEWSAGRAFDPVGTVPFTCIRE